MGESASSCQETPVRGSSSWQPPKVVWWMAIYLASFSVFALWWSYITRIGGLPAAWFGPSDSALLHGVYAVCWGCLGGCVNAGVAVAKHCADRDFDEAWDWWYLAKPPLGALMGVVVYVLSKGVGAFLGMQATTDGFGVAALAFVAGFATERVVRKIEELSKSLFAITPEPPSVTILEPAEGQHVTGNQVRVVASTQGATTYIRAACLEGPTAPVDLVKVGDGLHEGVVPLTAPPGQKTVHVATVCQGQAVAADVTIAHE